jgi:penicillin V acylase-like amidase (Ntn superfamily)
MRQFIIISSVVMILLVCGPPDCKACTIFKVTRGNLTLVGNNEDDNNPDTKCWFLVAERGKHGRVFFGYNDSIPQGGMNDQGLFFEWVADNPSPDWVRDPKKLNYPGSVCEKILEDAATVEEAIRFYERYNETAFLKSHLMLVDKTGASAILGWKNGALQIVRDHGGFQGLGYGFDTAQERVRNLPRLSTASTRGIVEACVQTGEYPTQ